MIRLGNGLKKESHPFACSLRFLVGSGLKKLIFFNVLAFSWQFAAILEVELCRNLLLLKGFMFFLYFLFMA